MEVASFAEPREVKSTAVLIPYDRFGKTDPNLEWLPLSGAFGSDFECFLVRFKPGASSMPHEHTGIEEFLVLEGEIEDCDGALFRAGDFVSYGKGSRHFSTSRPGCLLLVVVRGPNRVLSEPEARELTARANRDAEASSVAPD